MNEEQYPIRTYALVGEDNVVKYIKTFSLSSEESWLGNYEGAVQGIATDRFDYPVEIGMTWNSETMNFE
jgi:hypothetical protein